MEQADRYLIALEGGGTRSQAALMDYSGRVVRMSQSSEVNTNFVAYEAARQAVWSAVKELLQAAGIAPGQVGHLVSALVGPRFGTEVFGELLPEAEYIYYSEKDVIFARSGIFQPHGVALVAATGATAWGVRADDGRQVAIGGWGALLGDEGSAYAAGLLGLRAAVRSFEGRDPTPTCIVDALCQHFGLTRDTFHVGLVQLAYQKPLSRAEIAGLAPLVTKLAEQGDELAGRITAKVADDLASLALHAARRLFDPQEVFQVAASGGLLKAGEVILSPLRQGLGAEFPQAELILGTEEPAVALGKLALFGLSI